MRIRKKIISISLTLLSVLCIAVFGWLLSKKLFGSTNNPTSETQAQLCVIKNGETSQLKIKHGDMCILTLPTEEDIRKIEFSSSDDTVLRVDSGGRVDALKGGQATITASGDNFSGDCVVTVAADSEDASGASEVTTAYTANAEIVEINKAKSLSKLYQITVNRRTNTVTVYTYNDNNEYVVPVRAMVASCGMGGDDITPTGNFNIYFKEKWHALFGDCYGQYVTGFSGNYLFHSVPYYTISADDLETDQFNLLSTNASQGCVRLSVSDAKWIFDNCELDTLVTVIDEDGQADPLGTPPTIKIDESIGWDPTDPDSNNPYNDKAPVISGAEDITIASGESYDMLSGVTAVDTCSNDITDKINAVGNVITDKKGVYYVTYSVTDALNKSATLTVTVTVE